MKEYYFRWPVSADLFDEDDITVQEWAKAQGYERYLTSSIKGEAAIDWWYIFAPPHWYVLSTPLTAASGAGAEPVRDAGPEGLRLPAGGGGLMMDANAIQVRIGKLCRQFRLPTMGAQSVSRFTAARARRRPGDPLGSAGAGGRGPEAAPHRQAAHGVQAGRRQDLGDLEHDRVPLALRQQLGELASGSFVDRGVNVLAFGLPGTGKTHALCAVGHRLVEAGRSVLFAPAYRLVQDLLAAKRDLALPRQLRKLDNYDFLLLDDLGYLPQGAEESEVLFMLIAERYERRSMGITSNLVFSQWEHIFANPMATAAAIDRVVHHSVILEFDVPSYRTGVAQQRGQKQEVDRQE